MSLLPSFRLGYLPSSRLSQGELRLKLAGDAFSVAPEVPNGRATVFGVFSVSQTGTLVYAGEGSRRQLAWYDRTGRRLSVLGKPDRYYPPSISPDDKSVAVSIGDGILSDIWVEDLSREVMSRLTFRRGDSRHPVWSPDGNSVVFGFRSGSASTDVYRKPTSGNGSEELLAHVGLNGMPMDVSTDGKWLVYGSLSPTTGRDLWLLPTGSDRKPVPYLQTPFHESNGSFSSDSKWIAYDSDESGRLEVYVQAVPASGDKVQISAVGGSKPVWRRDGKELYYLSPDRKLMAVPARTGTKIEAGKPQDLFALRRSLSFTPSRDGQRFLVLEPVGGEDAAAVPPVTVVVNWQAGLKK